MIAILLAVLCLTDAAFAGFRAAAGRNPAVHKVDYYLRALWLGTGVGAIAIGVTAAWIGGTLTLDHDPRSLWAAYIAAAERLILVYAAFATLVLLALAVWTLPIGEHRSLSNVLVLGPLTLARPWVVVAGGLWALAVSDDVRVRIAIVLACAAQLGVGLVLHRMQARAQRRLVSRLCLPEGHLDADR